MSEQTSLERYIDKFPRSRELHERAKGILVRGATHDNRYRPPFPIYVTHARGCREWDVDGYEYIDYYGGHGGNILGHAHPSVVKAVKEQIEKGTHYGTSHELELEWAELIRKLVPCAERVEFTSSGTEANMLGVRVARAFTGRSKIIKFQGHFHGFYDPLLKGMLEPWDVPESGGIIPADLESIIVLPVNDLEVLEKALSPRGVALVMCEPLGAHSGTVGVSPSFYQPLRDLTSKYGTLLLFDEVITGFRCAPGGIQAEVGVTPDLTALGKYVTGGVPGAGAIVGRAKYMNMFDMKDPEWNRYKRVSHHGTYNGNPLCSAAGVAALRVLANGQPQKRANEGASRLRQGMERMLKEHNIDGCAYGSYSIFNVFFGGCPIRDDCDRKVCLNATKKGVDVGYSALINMTLNGILTARTGRRGFVTAVHTDADVDKTIKAFGITLDTLISEGALKKG